MTTLPHTISEDRTVEGGFYHARWKILTRNPDHKDSETEALEAGTGEQNPDDDPWGFWNTTSKKAKKKKKGLASGWGDAYDNETNDNTVEDDWGAWGVKKKKKAVRDANLDFNIDWEGESEGPSAHKSLRARLNLIKERAMVNKAYLCVEGEGASNKLDCVSLDEESDSEQQDYTELDLEAALRRKIGRLYDDMLQFELQLENYERHLPTRLWSVVHVVPAEKDRYEYYEVQTLLENYQGETKRVEARRLITDYSTFLQQNQSLWFVCLCSHEWKRKDETDGAEDVLSLAREDIRLENTVLRRALSKVLSEFSNIATLDALLESPWWFLYYVRKHSSCLSQLENRERQAITILLEFAAGYRASEHAEADALFEKGFLRVETVPYCFPKAQLVVYEDNGIKSALKLTSCIEIFTNGLLTAFARIGKSSNTKQVVPDGGKVNAYELIAGVNVRTTDEQDETGQNAAQAKTQADAYPSEVIIGHVRGYRWDFDEKMSVVTEQFPVKIQEPDRYVPISSLNIRPWHMASQAERDLLMNRGRQFLTFKPRTFVSYDKVDEFDVSSATDRRYMIDMTAFNRMHPQDAKQRKGDRSDVTETKQDPNVLYKSATHAHDPDFLALFPPGVKGYNMRTKKWVTLDVDSISAVEWNTEAFRSLVLDEGTKDIILALVTNQIESSHSTDYVGGKGNGLILLLHGGPGTGKTFTAESVAEVARKPLYRITCGDMGTDSVKVEQYLETAFHLGKLWDCVVLLDEADVFLEERTMQDLDRNALVSVFLRVLEYHDGILILTSNRVGSFDEAFKSRIQLAIHYDALGRPDRLKVWRNFFRRLEALDGVAIDFPDVRAHLDDLADFPLNGRQIRNAITNARSLAKHKASSLTYAQLHRVIEVSDKFDKYLLNLRRGATDEQLAFEDGRR